MNWSPIRIPLTKHDLFYGPWDSQVFSQVATPKKGVSQHVILAKVERVQIDSLSPKWSAHPSLEPLLSPDYDRLVRLLQCGHHQIELQAFAIQKY